MKLFLRIFQRIFLLFCAFFTLSLSAGETENLALRLNTGLYFPSHNDMIDRKDIVLSMKFWLQEMTKEINLDVSGVRLYDNITAMRDDFIKREIDYFVAPPLAIVKYFDLKQLADGFYGIRESGRNEALLLIANSKRITEFQDIVGKRLLLPYSDELAEVYLDTLTLKTFQKGYQQLFGEIAHKKKMKSIIYDLFFDRADVALVYQSAFEVMVEMNPQINTHLKVLQNYPIKAKNFSYFHRDYPLKDWIVNEAITLSSFPRGRQVLDIYQAAELGVCYIEALDTFASLYHKYIDLKRNVK